MALDLGGEQDSNLPTPLSFQTLKDWSYSGAVATTLYTVPVGKKVYITDFQTKSANLALSCQLSRDAAFIVSTNCPAAGQSDTRNFTSPLLFSTGEEINIVGSANHVTSLVVGWEE